MQRGEKVQWLKSDLTDSSPVNSKIIDTVLKEGSTYYLVEDDGTGFIHLLNPELITVINP